VISACHYDTANTDGAFYDWESDRKVHCAVDIDTFARNDLASVEAGLDRAVERGEVLELYAHDPGRTLPWDQLEAVLAAARDRNLAFFTYRELGDAQARSGPGILLSFDDASIASWVFGLDLFARYNARVTFFVSYFPKLSDAEIDGLHQLAAAGHAIEPHSIKHLRAPLYVEQKGLDAYMRDEALPSIDALERAGFDVTTYAYPYGSRTGELDEALLSYVERVRSVAFTWSGPADPCPD
jgi:peptidoglycan/xylan/chitin deacetylase (PgdA/CDA1 family)